MADKTPTLRCPLKLQGLMSNPSFVKNACEDPEYFTKIVRDRPQLVKCDTFKCGFFSSHQVTEDVDDDSEAGSHEERRTIEGCAIALLPERLERLSDVSDVLEEVAEASRSTSVLLAGAAKVAAAKLGLEEELEQLAEGEEGEETGEGEEEPAEEEAGAR